METTPVDQLQITRPDDWHVHLRDGPVLRDTCADLARYFGRAIVMPNLTPPATTVTQASSSTPTTAPSLDSQKFMIPGGI